MTAPTHGLAFEADGTPAGVVDFRYPDEAPEAMPPGDPAPPGRAELLEEIVAVALDGADAQAIGRRLLVLTGWMQSQPSTLWDLARIAKCSPAALCGLRQRMLAELKIRMRAPGHVNAARLAPAGKQIPPAG